MTIIKLNLPMKENLSQPQIAKKIHLSFDLDDSALIGAVVDESWL